MVKSKGGAVKIARRGLMLVISSPSGAGKSTIARNLLEDDPTLEISVSVTTRAKRPSEIAGKHYHFVSIPQFERMRESDALLEWAQVHGKFLWDATRAGGAGDGRRP